ncbi:ABC transporter substrate-binding protein [Paenibacillus sp. 481]|uniref:ABC transporter substrate-binding protein n=1 Tax=Paenibacillus sp. 481 TaxID=2835869 RepID=UPI001E29FAD0|nr:ABC transporter substrate-binding protein [Paenibacillus sp. 481]UHA75026.1 carbohydrate ABC transporter substrate-binding protein [Paenibacillus sp. 481]
MKRMAKWSLLMLLAVSVMVAGCGSKSDSTTGATEGGSGDVKTVKVFQIKVEIAEALGRLEKEFEKAHPNINLDIQTVGGGADYGAALKAKFAANDAPDIFNNGGYTEMNTWMEHLEDMSNEPWVKDVIPFTKEPMTKDGKLYGMPMNLEGYGFVYNKDLFAKAGITEAPKTLPQLEEAAKKLQAAGITPFANGYQEWWILGIHNLNVPFAHQTDANAFIKGLNDGTSKFAGNPEFENWVKLLDLTMKYGNKNPLTTDYNTQVTLFANGEAAMMQQGNWTQVQIDGINPNLNLGMLPMPLNDDVAKNDKLLVGVPNNWVVNKNSKVKEEAKTFLNWMVSSDIGKEYISKHFKFIPAMSTINPSPEDLGDLATEITKYSKENKVLGWNWFKYPDGATQEFGNAIQAYVAGKSDANKMFADFHKAWDNLKK